MKDGIFEKISIEDYHADKEYLSASSLKKSKKSPKHFDFYRRGLLDNSSKSYFDFGNAFELALLDKEEFENKVANEVDIYNDIMEFFPETKSFRATEKYKKWVERQHSKNKYIISKGGEESFSTIKFMLESCYQDAVIQKLIKNIEYQYSIFWTDKETGLKLKTRPDICKSKKNIIVDVKTTTDGSPEKFSKDLANYDYPFQAVMQIDGCLSSGFMERVDNYFWLVVEKEPPFSATLYEFSQEDIKWCTDEYNYYKHEAMIAIKENKYPSYSLRADNKYGILTATIPLWYRKY